MSTNMGMLAFSNTNTTTNTTTSIEEDLNSRDVPLVEVPPITTVDKNMGALFDVPINSKVSSNEVVDNTGSQSVQAASSTASTTIPTPTTINTQRKKNLANKYRPQKWDDLVEQDAIKQILSYELKTGNLKRCMLFTGGAGTGKCLGKDTPVKMFDGTNKLVQDIQKDDLLLGPDGNSRIVTSTCTGRELMYKVTLEDGSNFTCNKSHILTLKNKHTYELNHFNVEEIYNNLEEYKDYYSVKYNDPILYNYKIEQLQEDDYFGFTIEGDYTSQIENMDKCFVLGNGIITHNTTSARIFANEIESVHANIFEINCADNTGVDDIRKLLIEPSQVKPLTGKYKVFILDESHMLTTQSQNALLKILEEPPSYCVYILCTTDPQKVLPTIMSRTVRYDFQLISSKGILDRLLYILESEKNSTDGVPVESWSTDALELLTESCSGHLRNAVISLEKVLSFTKNITIADVEKVLGVTSYDILFNVLNSILNKDSSLLLSQIDTVAKSGMDLKLFVKNFLSFVLEVNKYLILKISGNINSPMELLTLPKSFETRLNVYNISHKDTLKLLLKILVELNSNLKWETDVRPVLETQLLLMVI